MAFQPVALVRGRRQLRPHREEVALQVEDPLRPRRVRAQRAGQAEGADGLVEGAVGLGMEVVLGNAAAVEKPRLSPIAMTGDDAHATQPPSTDASASTFTALASVPRARSSSHLLAAIVAVVASPTAVVI